MPTLTVSIVLLLLCNYISSDDIASTNIAITPSNQCSGTNASQCVFQHLCAPCILGHSPFCTEAICVNNQCKIIPACSISTPTTPSTLTQSSTTTAECTECENDGECLRPEYCVPECQNGFGPLCASAKCVNGTCQTISPCSQKPVCTNKDLSRCPVPRICALCIKGRTPSCAQATCENGQCKIISPCSISTSAIPSTSTKSSTTTAECGECPHPEYCVGKCSNNTIPLCASAQCVNGKCIIITPCSERICKTRATCSYNKHNCAKCTKGYGPGCEQAACSQGICSIVPPCSKKLATAVSSESTENK